MSYVPLITAPDGTETAYGPIGGGVIDLKAAIASGAYGPEYHVRSLALNGSRRVEMDIDEGRR